MADEIAKAVVDKLQVKLGDVSVGFEEVAIEEWKKKYTSGDILAKKNKLYKKPKY